MVGGRAYTVDLEEDALEDGELSGGCEGGLWCCRGLRPWLFGTCGSDDGECGSYQARLSDGKPGLGLGKRLAGIDDSSCGRQDARGGSVGDGLVDTPGLVRRKSSHY